MGSKIKTTYEIDSKFNPQGIIDGLRQVQKMLTQTTSNSDIFKGFSKALQEAQAKTNALKQQAEKGLTTQADIKAYQKLSQEVQGSLSGIIRQMSSLSRDSLQAYEKEFRATMRSQMDALKAERSQLEQALGASIKGESGKRSRFSGLTTESYIDQVRKGASFEDIFGPYRQRLESALEEAKKPVEDLTDAEKLLLKDLQDRHAANQQTLTTERENLRTLKESKESLIGIRERLTDEVKSSVSQKEVKSVLASSKLYSPLMANLEGLNISKNDLIKILSEGFSKTAKPESVFTQVSRAGLSKTGYSNLAPDIQQLIREEIQMLYGNTVRGSAQLTLPDIKNEINNYTQQIKDSNTAITNLTQESKVLTSKIDPLVQKGAAAAVQPQKINEAQQQLQDFGNWANTIGKPAYDALAQSMGKIANKQKEREQGLDAIKQAQDSANRSTEQASIGLTNGAKAEAEFLEKQKQLVGIQRKVNQTFDQLTYRLKYFFSVFTLYRKVSQMIRQTYSDVQNLDKAFASIAMVTSKTVNTLWQSYSQYAQIANKLGQSTEDAIKTSALYYQQGLETQEVLQLTESTMKLATLAAQDFETSTQELTAALRAFHMEMSEGEHVTDVYSELAAHAAADVSNIAAGMSKVASIASSAGSSFENTAAFLTQIIETTQESGVNAGTALKTIVARFTELKENVDDAEESFEDLDYNKIDKALKTIGISLKDEQGQIRDFDDLILELSGVWDTLSRNQQRYIATVAAGSRQQSRFIALLEDHDRLMELIGTATDSAGRSNQQFAKYADTINYKLSKIKNTWEQFRISLVNEKTIKNVLDTVQTGLDRILNFDWLDWAKIGVVFLGLGKTVATQFANGFKSVSILILNTLNNAMNYIPSKIGLGSSKLTQMWFGKLLESRAGQVTSSHMASQLNLFGVSGQTYQEHQNLLFQENSATEQDIKAAMAAQDSILQSYGATAATAVMAGFTSGLMQDDPGKVFTDTFKAGLTSTAMAGLNAAALAAGNGVSAAFEAGIRATGIGFLISIGISALSYLLKLASNEIKEWWEKTKRLSNANYDLAKSIEELKEKQEELNKQAQESIEKLNELSDEYTDLDSKVQKYKTMSQSILSEEEQEEFIKLSQEIANLAPSLVTAYTNEGEAIIDLGKTYDELIKKKKEALNLARIESAQNTLKANIGEYITKYNEVALKKEGLNDLSTLLQLQSGKSWEEVYTGDKQWIVSDLINRRDQAAISVDNYAAITHIIKKLGIGKELNTIFENNSAFLSTDFTSARKNPVNAKNLNDFFEGISNYLEKTNTKLQDYELKQKEAVIKQSTDDYLDVLLQMNDKYASIDNEMAKQAIRRSVLSKLGDIEELTKDFEEKYDTSNMNSTEIGEAFSQFLNDTFTNVKIDEIGEEISDNAIKIWTAISEKVDSQTTARQIADLIERSELDPKEKELWKEENRDALEGEFETAKKVSKLTGSTLSGDYYNFTFADGSLGDLYYKMGTEAGQFFVDGLEASEKGGKQVQEDFVSDLENLAKELGTKNFAKLFSLDWSEYSILTAQDYWSELGVESEKLKEIIEKYFANTNIISDTIIEKLQESFKEITDSISAAEKAVSSSIEDGFIDASAVQTLFNKGAPLEKIINDDSTINNEEMDKWLKDQLQSEEEIVEALEEQQKQKIQNLDATVKQLEFAQEITSELIIQKELERGSTLIQAQAVAEQLSTKNHAEVIEYYKQQLKSAGEFLDDDARILKTAKALYQAELGSYKKYEKERAEKAEEAAKKIEEANKKVADSYQNILDKQQDLIDKQNELNKVLYGSDTYKGSLDPMYNYEQRLERITEEIDDAKEALDDYTTENPEGALGTLMNGYHNEAVNLATQNSVYQGAIDNTINALNNELTNYLATSGHGFDTNISDFYKYNPVYKIFEVNQDAINKARMNDDLKNYIYEQLSAMNDYEKKITENEKKIKQRKKEFQDYQKKVRDDYISIQDKVVEMLKEKYQEEIDDRKDMYEALEKADSDYLDALQKAIDKERKLRDKQKKWDDLATKEKRLSLMRRDTSGANQKDIQSLQNEIQDDRQQLLDDTVDTIVDDLKELYDSQKESRDAEIEYQQSVLDNANLVREANNIMLSWKSLEDMQAWMAENTKDFEKLSDETVEKMQEDWAEMYFNIQEYNELTQTDIKDVFDYTSAEIQDEIESTTETLTTEAGRALQEVTKSVEDSIEGAENAVTSAMKALTEAQEAYNKAIKEYNDLINDTNKNNDGQKKEEEENIEEKSRREELAEMYKANKGNSGAIGAIIKKAKEVLSPNDYKLFESEVGITPKPSDYYYSPKLERFNELFEAYNNAYNNHNSNAISAIQQSAERDLKGTDLLDKFNELTNKTNTTYYENTMSFLRFKEMLEFYNNNPESTKENYLDLLTLFEDTKPSTKNVMEQMVNAALINRGLVFKAGGLVDYTGPAWVDGTKSKPEAFLSAADTQRIGEAASILHDLPWGSISSLSGWLSNPVNSYGDSNIEININVDSIATEDQVDYLINRMKDEITEAANPIGTTVIRR